MIKRTIVLVVCIAVCCITLTGCETLDALRNGITLLRQGLEDVDFNFGGGVGFPNIPDREEEPEVIEEVIEEEIIDEEVVDDSSAPF